MKEKGFVLVKSDLFIDLEEGVLLDSGERVHSIPRNQDIPERYKIRGDEVGEYGYQYRKYIIVLSYLWQERARADPHGAVVGEVRRYGGFSGHPQYLEHGGKSGVPLQRGSAVFMDFACLPQSATGCITTGGAVAGHPVHCRIPKKFIFDWNKNLVVTSPGHSQQPVSPQDFFSDGLAGQCHHKIFFRTGHAKCHHRIF